MRRLRRLRAMSLDEVVGRSRQQARRWFDTISPVFAPTGEVRAARVRAPEPDPHGLDLASLWRQFFDTTPRRFFAGALDPGALAGEGAVDPAWLRETVEDADAICDGRFTILGYHDVEFGTPIDWHLDPRSGRRAPARHWSRIDPLDAQAIGDSKVIWELNRHQWMVTLARAWCLTQRPRYARAVFARLDEWTKANPYPIGINWSSSLEVSLRLIAWCWTLVLLRESPELTTERFGRWRTLMLAHAAHVERYLSRYFSPNTHLTGEALGLVYAGVVFAESPQAARWRDLGTTVLVEELDRQVGHDGAHFERATCYQRYTIEIYLHLLVLARRSHLRLPAHVPQVVSRMVHCLVALLRPDRVMPNIGDADGGWLLPVARRSPDDCRGVLGLAAAVLEVPEAAWAAGGEVPEVFWLLGNAGLQAAARIEPHAPKHAPSQVFDAGGYAIMSTGWGADAHQLVVDVGPLGCPISAAHGHAGLLGVQCTAFGEPFLVDAGTYCYTADAVWRTHFRGTRAHNTATVDGRHQADPAGPFAWQARPVAILQHWESSPAHDLVDAVHDGYMRLPDPVRHRRRVLFVKPFAWVVVDDLLAAGEHDVEIRYQFTPRRVALSDHAWVRADGVNGRALWLLAVSASPLAVAIRCGGTNPIDGWISTAYGEMRPAPAMVCRVRTTGPSRVTTLIVPSEDARTEPPNVEVVREPDGQLVSIHFVDARRRVHIDGEVLLVDPSSDRERIA